MAKKSTVGATPTARPIATPTARPIAKSKTRPIAMVAPRPAGPPDAVSSLTLAQALQLLGNDRAYTLIRFHNNSWRVHFEGDLKPVTIRVVDSKPEIS